MKAGFATLYSFSLTFMTWLMMYLILSNERITTRLVNALADNPEEFEYTRIGVIESISNWNANKIFLLMFIGFTMLFYVIIDEKNNKELVK